MNLLLFFTSKTPPVGLQKVVLGPVTPILRAPLYIPSAPNSCQDGIIRWVVTGTGFPANSHGVDVPADKIIVREAKWLNRLRNVAVLRNLSTIYIPNVQRLIRSESCVTSQKLHIFVIETNDVTLAIRNNLLLITLCNYVILFIYINLIDVWLCIVWFCF